MVDESGAVGEPAGGVVLSAGGVIASGPAAGGVADVESAGGAACGSVAFCFEHAAVTASTPRQRKTALRFMEDLRRVTFRSITYL